MRKGFKYGRALNFIYDMYPAVWIILDLLSVTPGGDGLASRASGAGPTGG